MRCSVAALNFTGRMWRSASPVRSSCCDSVLLVIESRMGLGAIVSEVEFVAKVSQHYGDDLAQQSLDGLFYVD